MLEICRGKKATNYSDTYRAVLSDRISNTPAKPYCVRGATFHCLLPKLQQEAR